MPHFAYLENEDSGLKCAFCVFFLGSTELFYGAAGNDGELMGFWSLILCISQSRTTLHTKHSMLTITTIIFYTLSFHVRGAVAKMFENSIVFLGIL